MQLSAVPRAISQLTESLLWAKVSVGVWVGKPVNNQSI